MSGPYSLKFSLVLPETGRRRRGSSEVTKTSSPVSRSAEGREGGVGVENPPLPVTVLSLVSSTTVRIFLLHHPLSWVTDHELRTRLIKASVRQKFKRLHRNLSLSRGLDHHLIQVLRFSFFFLFLSSYVRVSGDIFINDAHSVHLHEQ